MVMNKLKRIVGNKITGVVVTILTFVIVFGAIFSVSNLSIAEDTLPGIDEIRNNITVGDGSTYTMLEVVPSLDKAELGYLVSGEEPMYYDATTQQWMDWKVFLAANIENPAYKDQSARETFVNGLFDANYMSVGGMTDDKPMWYQTYQEVTQDTPGAQSIVGGNQSVTGWLQSEAVRGVGWNAKFTQLPITNKTLAELEQSKIPYYLVETGGATPVDGTTLENGGYCDTDIVYVQDTTNTETTAYIPLLTIAELKAQCDADASHALYDTVNTTYSLLKFRLFVEADYINLTPTDPPLVLYEAQDITYMESDAPYSLTISGTKGHTLVKPAKVIYYTGGFYSNDWFKKEVLNIDDTEVANYNVQVVEATAAQLSAMTVDELSTFLMDMDFIYLNAGTNDAYHYQYEVNDLDDEAVKIIFERICNQKIPCIVDYAFIGKAAGADTNTGMYALTCMLMQNNYRGLLSAGDEFNVDYITEGHASNKVSEWSGTIKNVNNYNYVNGNVMVVNTTLANNYLVDNFAKTPYTDAVISTGDAYSEVLSEIELENLYRASDTASGYGQLSTDIYKATVIRYIINNSSQRAVEKKTYVNVLEIQPANVRYPDNQTGDGDVSDTELTPARIRTWLGVDNSVTVNITTMNTMEFIGTIEDLNSEYDLIYIGADIYGLQTKDSGGKKITNYGEVSGYASMDGLIYTNVGGLTPVKGQFSGHLETDYIGGKDSYGRYTVKKTTVARYNGNDITAEKHNRLVDYVKGAYPVVVSDVLCASETAPTNTRVDNCSYMYSFLEQHLKDDNVFKASEIEAGKNVNFKFYANRGKLSIGTKVVASQEASVTSGTAFVQPGTYMTGNDTTEGHVTYITRENGKYYLKYRFTITNNGAVYGSTKYTAALFLDSNSDGKFSTEYESISDITLTHVATGQTVKNGELVAGEQYTLSRQVPETYSGVLTWKVEVSQTSNKFIRDSVTGYTRLSDTQKETIKVLQVRRDGGYPLVLETAIGNSKGTGSNNTLSALVWGGKCNADGKNYAGITDNFQFHFTTMTNAQFNTAYNQGKLNLMDYDMLVLGFYDSYDLRYSSETDISYNAVNGAGGIKEYIDSGKSVLFAHDTTSVTVVDNYKNYYVEGYTSDSQKKNNNYRLYTSNTGTGANVWGYNLNMYIRDMVGLDTYGITAGTKDGINYAPLKSGKDLSTTTAGKELMSKLTNTLDANGYYKIGLKPLAYLPNSNKTKTVGETQGFLYGWMDYNWRSGDEVTYRSVRSVYNTDRAERVNEGQITTYPYYLDETIDITRTHHQYFTLDMNVDDDGDGETDLVVWYTMGGKKGDNSHQDNKYYGVEANFDNTSEKDVMNNYYIYNKGNITYTGFGDFDSTTWRDRATVVEECKLFVNTLVAAYGTGLKEPDITVYDPGDNWAPADKFYEYGDIDNNVAFRETSQRMYYTVNDTNVMRGNKSAASEYLVALKPGATAPAGYATEVKDGVTYIKLTDLKTYNEAGVEVDRTKLECGKLYYVDIPTSVFDMQGVSGQNVNTFMVKSVTTLQKVGSLTGVVTEQKTKPAYHTVEFVHVELFPLD